MQSKYTKDQLIALVKSHPSFPFPDNMTNREHFVILSFFWLYFTKMFVDSSKGHYDRVYGYHDYYSTLQEYLLLSGLLSNDLIDFFDETNRCFGVAPYGNTERIMKGKLFRAGVGMDAMYRDGIEMPDKLFNLSIQIDLTDSDGINKGYELMHDFFIKKLSLQEMEKRVEEFDPQPPYEPDDD